MENKLFLYLFIMVLFISLSSAVPPVTTVDYFPSGYTITEAQQIAIKTNTNFTYNFILYNSSNGISIDNTTVTCRFFIASNNGSLLFNDNASFLSNGYWAIDIPSTVFYYNGEYSYGLDCQDGSGGALAGTFYTTPTGLILDDNYVNLYVVLIVVLFVSLVILLYKFSTTDSLTTKYSFIAISYILLNILLLLIYKISEYFLYVIPFFMTFFKILYTVSNIGYFVFFPVLFAIIILNNLRDTQINKLRAAGNSDEDIMMSLNRGKRR